MRDPARSPAIAAVLLVLAVGCGKDPSPPLPPSPEPILFYEPVAFCLAGDDTARTLTLYNLGEDPLTWTPRRVPSASSGWGATVVVPPHDLRSLTGTWSPGGSYPVLDTLVAETDDPARRQVAIPFRREDPAGATDTVPPDPPLLASPADGATIDLDSGTREAEIVLVWSVLDDCSGIQGYRLDISLAPDFSQIVFSGALGEPPDTLVAEEGDAGTAYWRVSAQDGAGLWGAPSEARSWTIRLP